MNSPWATIQLLYPTLTISNKIIRNVHRTPGLHNAWAFNHTIHYNYVTYISLTYVRAGKIGSIMINVAVWIWCVCTTTKTCYASTIIKLKFYNYDFTWVHTYNLPKVHQIFFQTIEIKSNDNEPVWQCSSALDISGRVKLPSMYLGFYSVGHIKTYWSKQQQRKWNHQNSNYGEDCSNIVKRKS